MDVRKALLGLTLALLLGNGVVVAADFDKGLEAVKSGDYETALREWTPLAEQGDARAEHNLGVIYYFGQGVVQNDKTAVKWWTKAAEQGNADSQYNLGAMYSRGTGVPENDKKAVSWYNLAAEQGHAMAQTNLGIMFDNGEGVLTDYKVAYMWFNLGAYNGNKLGSKYKEAIVKKMTSAQIDKAQEMSSRCLQNEYKDCWVKKAAETEKLIETQQATNSPATHSAMRYIRDEIGVKWVRPANARNGMVVELIIYLVPTGEVVNVEVSYRDPSATDAFVLSVVKAVKKVRRFDKLSQLNSVLFDANFRQFTVKFKPEDLRL